jgi:hypothetical protein
MKFTKSKLYGATKEIRESLTNAFKNYAKAEDKETLKVELSSIQDSIIKLINEIQ